MKKKIVLLSLLLTLTGCTSNKELYCEIKNVKKSDGIMTSMVTFNIDENDKVVSSKIIENWEFATKEGADAFFESYKNNSERINDTEVKYTIIQEYTEDVTKEEIKKAMEGQEYSCNYK